MAEAPISNNDLVRFRGRAIGARKKGKHMSRAAKMFKSGAISDKEYGKLTIKKTKSEKRPRVQDEDAAGPPIDEISPSPASPGKVIAQASKPDGLGETPLSAKSKPNATGKLGGANTAAADNPSGTFRKRGSDQTFRGQPQDKAFKTT